SRATSCNPPERLPIRKLRANLFVQRRSRFVFVVVIQNLTLARAWPCFLERWRQSRFHIGQILDPVTRQRNSLARRSHSGRNVIPSFHQRVPLSSKRLFFTSKILVTNLQQILRRKIRSPLFAPKTARHTPIKIPAFRIRAANPRPFRLRTFCATLRAILFPEK